MLRLALLATAIAYVSAGTSGSAYTLYLHMDGTNADSSGAPVTSTNASCKAGTGTSAVEATGTTAGPTFAGHTGNQPTATTIGIDQMHSFILGECYQTAAGVVPMGFPMAAGTGSGNKIQDNGEAILTFKVQKGTSDVLELLTYQAVDCATLTTTNSGIVTAAEVTGIQCGGTGAASGAFSTGYTSSANSANGWRTTNYIELGYNGTTSATPAVCTAGDDIVTNVGVEKTYLEVAADDDTAHPATINTFAALNGMACFSGDNATDNGESSYNAYCDLETGDLTYNTYATHSCLAAAGADSARFNRNASCVAHGNVSNKNFKYTAADVATLCASPGAAGATASEWFTMYSGVAGTTCDETYDGATAAENIGTKAVILGVCYTNADATGSMTGMEGPFSLSTVVGTSEPVAIAIRTAHGLEARGGSYKFAKASNNITAAYYASPDCSGTAAGTKTADDPGGNTAASADWPCQNSSKLTHGGAAVTATGNSSKLQTATKFLTVRAYGDVTTSYMLNTAGNCLGEAVGLQVSGQRVDHFVLDQCFQNSATTSYKWKCEDSQTAITNATDGDYYPISYEEFTDVACTTAATNKYKWFTQTSFNACADDTTISVACIAGDIDDSTEFAKQTISCGSCSTSTSKSEAACLALATPGTWTAGTCTNVNGAAGEFGGKCVLNTAGSASTTVTNSWEILTDNATWNAICGVPTASSTTTTTTTSGAGKIAATAAAAAAAAALLL